MKPFNTYIPTEIIFGSGKISEIGEKAKKFGSNVLLVTGKKSAASSEVSARVIEYLLKAGLKVTHFDGVRPNPTTEIVSAGADMAKASGAQVIIGLGGGSGMDTAKAIAVEASHPGTAWDYLHYKTQPTTDTLPIIAISTTSGTGSQVTPCAVITNTAKKDKSAIWNENIFPKVAIVDPELMLTLPPHLTATVGFDTFCHNFEAYISNGTNPYVEMLALQGIRSVKEYLPRAFVNDGDLDAREHMAWADTLGGIAISLAGVTLPHGLGMQISGHCPNVSHGESLAVQYPAFTRYTYGSCIEKFAAVARIFNEKYTSLPDDIAAEGCCEEIDKFIKDIGLWTGLRDLKVSLEDIRMIADAGQVLNDYKNNPRIATIDDMYKLLVSCYER